MVDENAMLDDIFAKVGQSADVIDLRGTFTDLKDEYLYFKTDHHWTPNGAYRAYEQFCSLKGLTPFDRAAHEPITVTDFQGTHYSATRLWNVENDEITYYPLDSLMTIYKITGEAAYEPETTENIVNMQKFNTRDKYAAFWTATTVIQRSRPRHRQYSGGQGQLREQLCALPDRELRENRCGGFPQLQVRLDSTIEKEGYDEVLVLYNFQTFIADTNLIYISRPSTLS